MLESVCRLLEESGIRILAQARDGEEALRAIEEHAPQVALLDVRMRGLDGFEVTRRATRSAPGTAVVLYTSYGDRALVTQALDLGVRGYVLKEAPLAELIRAIGTVAAGGSYVDGALLPALVRAEAADERSALTQREREVLRLLADGLRNEEIGQRLFISPETVRAHIAKARRKLDADTRTQAVAIALRRSLIS